MNYWLEALESSLDDHGAYNLLTKEQREAVAKDLERASEMHGEATGTFFIPNPLQTEIDRLQKRIDKEKEATEKQRMDFLKNISMRHNVPISQIRLEEDGHATVYP